VLLKRSDFLRKEKHCTAQFAEGHFGQFRTTGNLTSLYRGLNARSVKRTTLCMLTEAAQSCRAFVIGLSHDGGALIDLWHPSMADRYSFFRG
jgi:hypothetical protein